MSRVDGNLAFTDEETQTEHNCEQFYAQVNAEFSKNNKRLYCTVKRIADLALSILGIIVLSPLFLLIAILIKLDDGGPVFHVRYCLGKNNTQYKMYKFRSMVKNADDIDLLLSEKQKKQLNQEQKVEDDPRITRIGRILRKTSLDELPQLVSILKSDMSFVGPRPIVWEEAQYYGNQLEYFLSAKPGLTGLWQISGRSDCTYESGERQQVELRYVRDRSLLMDIKIFIRTFGVVIGRRGAR